MNVTVNSILSYAINKWKQIDPEAIQSNKSMDCTRSNQIVVGLTLTLSMTELWPENVLSKKLLPLLIDLVQ